MDLDYLVLNIKYDIEKDSFETSGNINKEGRKEIIDTFLRMQIGKGEDVRKANKRDIYNIQMKWYPVDDNIKVSSDTGNNGLREGILMRYVNSL